jgi:hypothetical protein
MSALKEMIEHCERMAKGKDARVRKCADRVVDKIARDVSGWGSVTITFSMVSTDYNQIVYRSKGGYKSGFYDRNDNPWDITLRGDDYWVGVLQIVNWYKTKKRRLARQGR